MCRENNIRRNRLRFFSSLTTTAPVKCFQYELQLHQYEVLNILLIYNQLNNYPKVYYAFTTLEILLAISLTSIPIYYNKCIVIEFLN